MKKIYLIVFLFLSVRSFGQFVNNNRQIINVLNYGAKGDMQSRSDGSYTGTTTFTGSGFTAADVGKTIRIQLAASDLITTIAGFTNSTTITLTNSTTGTRSSQSYDYGTDNTSYLQRAANAVPTTGGVLYFPFGYYMKNGLLNIPNPTKVMGEMTGRFASIYDSNSSNTNRPNSKIIEIAYNIPQSVTIQSSASQWENLDLITTVSVQPTAGVGLNINADNLSITNSSFASFWIAVSQNYSAYWVARHCSFAGYQYGLVIRNLNTADAGDWLVDDCLFGGFGSHPMSSAALMQSSGGMKFTNCKWNVGIHKCVSVEILSSASNTSDFQIINCSLENFDSTGINIIANNSAVFSNIVINGNQIAPYTSHSTAINLNGTGSTFFKGIAITNNSIYDQSSGDTAIKVIGAQDAIIASNAINGNWTKKIYVDGTSTNVSYVLANQVAVGTDLGSVIGSANFTSNGTTTTVQDYLKISNSVHTAGVIPELFSDVNNLAAYSELFVNPSSGTNVAQTLSLTPAGTGATGVRTGLNLFGTNYVTDQTNYELFFIRHTGTAIQMLSTAGGSGGLRPIQMSASASNTQLSLFTNASVSGNIGINSATDNATAFLQVTGTSTQMALHYDASNKTLFTTSSAGNMTVAPSGGTMTLTGNLTLGAAGNALNITEGSNGRVGQTTLVSGTKAITITGLTTSSRAFVTLVTPSGVTLTTTYQAVCTSNTLTIQANVAAGTINTSDASVLNYFVIN